MIVADTPSPPRVYEAIEALRVSKNTTVEVAEPTATVDPSPLNLERFEEVLDHNAQTTVEVPLRKGTEEEEETDNRDNIGNPEQ